MCWLYISEDDAYRYSARQFAMRSGLHVDCIGYLEAMHDQCNVAVYDLDTAPLDYRPQLIATLSCAELPHPVAVHSYNLEPGSVCAMRANGVMVFNSPDEAMRCGLLFYRPQFEYSATTQRPTDIDSSRHTEGNFAAAHNSA